MLTMTLENVHNFSLECLTTFLPVPFSYNSPSHSFFLYVKFQSIVSLLSYNIILMTLNYTLYYI